MSIKPCLKAAFGDSDFTADGHGALVLQNRAHPLISRLIEIEACPRSRYWTLETKAETLKEIWDVCPRGDWMAWLVSKLYLDESLVPAQWFARALIHLARDGVIDTSELHWVNRMLDQIEAGSEFDTAQVALYDHATEPLAYPCVHQYRVFQLAIGVYTGSTRYMWQAFSCDEDGEDAFTSIEGRVLVRKLANKLREVITFEEVEELWKTL